MRTRSAPLFIMSHMRSYSSLLSHVLGSHPEIDGYCETHLRYHFPFDVIRLRRRVRKLTGEPLRGRYVLDKILHNYTMSPAILESRRTRAVFLLRQPADVVQSILYMGTHLDPLQENVDVGHVTSYYMSRLQRLTHLAKVFGRRAALIESEALLDHTDDTLEFLRDYLELGDLLQRRYRRFAKTGKPSYGDPSPAIHAGEITVRKPTRPHYLVAPSLMSRVMSVHASCLDACRRYCVSMPAPLAREVLTLDAHAG